MLVVAALSLAAPAMAADRTGTEMLFDRTALADVEAGSVLRYTHIRHADDKIPLKPLVKRTFVLSIVDGDGGAMTEVRRFNGNAPSGGQNFPASSGNPLPPIFLTSTVNAVTFATKGSSFYIKNRFQDAIYNGGEVSKTEIDVDGETVDATEIIYRPFKDDPNASKMGLAFASLEMQVILSDAIPGDLVSIATRSEVDGVEYFVEEIAFIGTVEE
jgi:hypothetical protein